MSNSHSPAHRPTPAKIDRMMERHSPFHQLLRITTHSVDEEQAECHMPLEEKMFHAGGYLHGGISYALADASVALLLLWRLGFERKVFTIEGKLNYLASVPTGTQGTLIAHAKAVQIGKTTAVVDADVYSDAQRHLCHGIFTYAIR